MKIKKLVMNGFKSFADRTEFEFGDGLTGLVGPNGCGKSNIVDAIKWVLGEQRPTSLRGKEMGDVIFNGNATRKSMGFCEVNLFIDNKSGMLPIETEELQVARRVYRDGKSEYIINKAQVRLRDVKELFMDTGLGMDHYSVIEQGQIGRLLQSNNKERRQIFEEAAGISKYLTKRKETERKLDHTEQNLLRLQDIIDELGRRIRSVRRQAAKARRYRDLAEQLKQMQTTLAMRDYKVYSEELALVEGRLKNFSADDSEFRTRIGSLESEVAQAQERLVDLEEEISAKNAARYEHSQVVTTSEELIKSNQSQTQRLELDSEEGRQRLEELLPRLAEVEVQLASVQEQAGKIELNCREKQQELDSSLMILEEGEKDYRSHMADIENQRDEVFKIERERVELANAVDRESHDISVFEAGCNRIQRRVDENENRMEATRNRCRQVQQEVEDISDELEILAADVKQQEQNRISQREHLQATAKTVDRIRQETTSARSRLEVLADLKDKLEGAGRGVKAVLAEDNRAEYSGIKGMLADFFRVDMKYAQAIESALGGCAGAVLAQGRRALLDNFSRLRAEQAGRVTFLSSEFLPADIPSPPTLSGPGIIGNAFDLIQVDESYRRIFQWLLQPVYVVEDLEVAFSHIENTSRVAFVTLEGDILNYDGSISGGSEEGVGLVRQRVELHTLEDRLAQLAKQYSRENTCYQEIKVSLEGTGDKLKSLRQTIYERNIPFLEKRNEIASLKKEMDGLQGQVQADNSELAQSAQELAESQKRKDMRQAELVELAGAVELHGSKLGDMKNEIATKETRLRSAREVSTHARVQLAHVEAGQESVINTLSHLRQEFEDKQRALEDTRNRISYNTERREQLTADISEREKMIAASLETKNELDLMLVQLKQERENLLEKSDHNRGEVKLLHEKSRNIEEQLSELRVEENRLCMQIDNLSLRMQEEYQIDLSKAIGDFKPEKIEDINWDELRGLVTKFKEKIRNLGNVNLDSLEELEELEARFDFLDKQQQDLVQAKTSLEEVIERINNTCIKRFITTFEAVRGNFKALFRKLFGGGKADLMLADPENVLESGIDIIARPPGKLPKSLNLLSGGEKAMTSVALLFAIFESHPAPFCILDEVDAPLDDNNIERFVNMLRGFLDRTQFLVITHNKRTMAMADLLYGVTQQESGISKKISVHFEEESAVA
ncbi:chromosome segregation protein SMC [Planctomycetota bacterium]